MPLSGLDRFFWLAGFFGHALLLVVLLWKRRARHFPAFTALIANNLLRTVLLFVLRSLGYMHAYTLAYYADLAVDSCLQCVVVYEVASHVFRPLGHWAPDARRSLQWLVAGSLLVAAVLVWLAAPRVEDWRLNLLNKANFFTASLMSELFLGLLLLSVTTGLPWRTHVARIAYGLGLYSLFDILLEAGQTAVGKTMPDSLGTTLTHLRMTTYLCCVLYWVVTLWREAPQSRRLPAKLQGELQGMQTRLAYDLFTLRSWKKP